MNRITVILLISLGLLGCSSPDYSNKESYEISNGETFTIYFTSNSCCQQCFSNANEQSTFELLDQKVVESEPDCAGCDETTAYTFKATNIGQDTLFLHSATMNNDCHDEKERVAKFVVIVK